jgi:SAM-dependent methyltransferase
MLLPNNSDIDVGELASKVKQVAEERRRSHPLFTRPANDAAGPVLAPAMAQPSGWRATLKRIPVLGPTLVRSAAAYRAFRTPGVGWRYRIRLIPGVGGLVSWIYSLIRLNAIRAQITHELVELRHFQQASKMAHAHASARIDYLENTNAGIRLDRLEDVSGQMDTQLGQIHQHFEQINAHVGQIEKNVQVEAVHAAELLGHLQQLRREQDVTYHLAAQTAAQEDALRGMVKQIENSLASLTRKLNQLAVQQQTLTIAPKVGTENGVSGAAVDSNLLPSTAANGSPKPYDVDNFYVDFEAAFRGSSEDIGERLAVYLPHLQKFAGDKSVHVADVGCGRGEWLRLLKENDIEAIGIDLNSAMVDMCRNAGYKAEHEDAIAYLRRQPAGSLAAVTGFHIIEHLPFDILIALFDAALHALRDDGLIIFETPNPENLMVGACSFYSDPTHLHPIVPQVAEFIARQRGFAHAEILRLHPFPDTHKLPEDSELARRINNALYGPQDFAVLAWKNHAS